MIDRFTVEKIKSVARIEDVAGDFLSLRRDGRELTCACPFHNGKKLGHFKVVPGSKNYYHCFVCGAHSDPIAFLMNYHDTRFSFADAIRWLGAKYGIHVDDEKPVKWKVLPRKADARPIEREQEKEMLIFPLDMVKAQANTDNDPFCQWLRSLPWNNECRGRLEKVIKAYLVGHSRTGMTIFWQVDDEGRCRTGKLMRYMTNGHRMKEGDYNQDWVHSVIYRTGRKDIFDIDKQEMKTCLFGLHLFHAKGIEKIPKTVNIVESEKTAIIMAIANGIRSGLWMATGGLQFLRKESIESILMRGWHVVLYPDKDGEQKWRDKMTAFGFRYRDDYQINNQYLDKRGLWTEDDGEKADAADIMVRRIIEASRSNEIQKMEKVIDEWKTIYPPFATLFEKFELEPIELTENARQ